LQARTWFMRGLSVKGSASKFLCSEPSLLKKGLSEKLWQRRDQTLNGCGTTLFKKGLTENSSSVWI